MPIAIYYLTWDSNKMVIEKNIATFPQKESKKKIDLLSILKKSNIKMNQVIENFRYENFIIIIVPIGSKEEKKIIELLVLFLDLKESDTREKYLTILKTEEVILNNTIENEKKQKFLDFAQTLITQSMPKIILMGLPNSGKTSTKLFYFEKIQELKLIDKNIDPTEGFESQLYEIMALNVSVFDTSGQELDRWFNEPDIILAETEIIFFFFSVNDWQDNKTRVKDYLKKLKNFISSADHQIKLKVFCHKFDLITEKKEEFKKDVKDETKTLDISIMFTSIVNGGNFDLLNSFYFLFRDFSYIVNLYHNSVEPLIKQYGFRPLLLFDEKFSPLASLEIDGFEAADISHVRNYFIEWISLNQKTLKTELDMTFFTYNEQIKYLGFIKLPKFFTKISYVVISFESFSKIDAFKENLNRFGL